MHLQVVTNRMHLTLSLTQVVTNRMHGYLRMRIAQFLTTIHTTPHVIYLTRHGQSEYARRPNVRPRPQPAPLQCHSWPRHALGTSQHGSFSGRLI